MALITCPSCGNTVSDKAVVCPKCGASIHGAIQSQFQGSTAEDKPGCWVNGISFFLPIVGIILYFMQKESKPLCAKSYLNYAIAGVVAAFCFNFMIGCLSAL